MPAGDCLYLCETCVRDAVPPPGETTLGRQLADAVERLLEPARRGTLILRRTACLNACLSPCSIALRGLGKQSLRVSRLTPADAEAVAALALAYHASAAGEIPDDCWPAGLRARLSARAPAIRPRPL